MFDSSLRGTNRLLGRDGSMAASAETCGRARGLRGVAPWP